MGRKSLNRTEDEKKELIRLANKKYRESEGGKLKIAEANRKYSHKEEFREKKKIYNKRYNDKKKELKYFDK